MAWKKGVKRGTPVKAVGEAGAAAGSQEATKDTTVVRKVKRGLAARKN